MMPHRLNWHYRNDGVDRAAQRILRILEAEEMAKQRHTDPRIGASGGGGRADFGATTLFSRTHDSAETARGSMSRGAKATSGGVIAGQAPDTCDTCIAGCTTLTGACLATCRGMPRWMWPFCIASCLVGSDQCVKSCERTSCKEERDAARVPKSRV
jgi:hypothetical protein